MNDNRVDRSQHVTGGSGSTMVVGGDQTGNTVTTTTTSGKQSTPPTVWDKLTTGLDGPAAPGSSGSAWRPQPPGGQPRPG